MTELTTKTGSLIWYDGFSLAERVDRQTFFPNNALLLSENVIIPKANILQINKLGADVIGVGMKLNRNLTLAFTNVSGNGSYRVITSDDGINWDDVEMPRKKYQADANGKIYFMTNHFSYFALLSDVALIAPPSCSITISPSTVTNGS